MPRNRCANVVLFVTVLLAVMTMGSTCTPKKTCSAIQRWNVKTGAIMTAVWAETWAPFYADYNATVAADLFEHYDAELDEASRAELIGALMTQTAPTSSIALEVYEAYQAKMAPLDKASEGIEKTLDSMAIASETLEHAMIACQDFTDKDIKNAVIEIGQGLLNIIDILTEAGVEVPQMVVDAKNTVDLILDEIKAGNGF